MYGWIQQCIESLVLAKFGRDTWARIKMQAGCEGIPDYGFVRHECYDDSLTLKLVAAAAEVLEMSAATVLQVFGDYFIRWLVEQGYASMLKQQGKHLYGFLQNMNKMHANLAIGMPLFIGPIISVCAAPSVEDCTSLILHYGSYRGGLETMMIGIVEAVAESLYGLEITCTMGKQWQEVHAKTGKQIMFAEYTVALKGPQASQAGFCKPVPSRSFCSIHGDTPNGERVGSIEERQVAFSFWRQDSKTYTFFQHNPSMAEGWVGTVREHIDAIVDERGAREFGQYFDVRMLTSLIESYNPIVNKALLNLFRTPLKNPVVDIPVPTLGYVPRSRGDLFAVFKTFDTMELTTEVTFGRQALIRTTHRRGYEQVPVVVLVCAVPNLHTSPRLIRAFYDTPNESLLPSVPCRLILTAMWAQVRYRYCFDIALELCLVTLATFWIRYPDAGYVGWPFQLCVFIKHALDEIVQISMYARYHWLRLYFTGANLADWVKLCSDSALLYAILVASPELNDMDRSTRYPLAIFACLSWWRLLYFLRAFEWLGPKVLPIIKAVQGLGPFMVVLILLMMGFVYILFSLETLSDPPGDIFKLVYIAGFLADIQFDMLKDRWAEVWLFVISFLVALLLVNILVGVLSEAYDLHQDNHMAIYSRERAGIIFNMTLTMLPLPVGYIERFPWYLQWLLRFVAFECSERACGDDVRYLWLCTTPTGVRSNSRLRNVKDHVTMEVGSVATTVQEATSRLENATSRLENKMDNLQDGLRSLESRMNWWEQNTGKCPVFQAAREQNTGKCPVFQPALALPSCSSSPAKKAKQIVYL